MQEREKARQEKLAKAEKKATSQVGGALEEVRVGASKEAEVESAVACLEEILRKETVQDADFESSFLNGLTLKDSELETVERLTDDEEDEIRIEEEEVDEEEAEH